MAQYGVQTVACTGWVIMQQAAAPWCCKVVLDLELISCSSCRSAQVLDSAAAAAAAASRPSPSLQGLALGAGAAAGDGDGDALGAGAGDGDALGAGDGDALGAGDGDALGAGDGDALGAGDGDALTAAGSGREEMFSWLLQMALRAYIQLVLAPQANQAGSMLRVPWLSCSRAGLAPSRAHHDLCCSAATGMLCMSGW